MIYDDDADLSALDGKTVAILGYGSQGHAHALNLKDSGVDVVVGLREDSSSVQKAKADGLEVLSIADAASRGDVVMILLPDEKQGQLWREEISDGIAPGNTLMFAHGFAILYGEVEPGPGVDVGMAAPKGPGHLVRRQYEKQEGMPGLVAIHADERGSARDVVLAYAKGIGCTRARRDRDHLQGRDRDRPVRRAGRALRRRLRAGPGGLRDAGRCRLRPPDGVLRVPARGQADRGPDVREGPGRDALLDLQHGRVRRLHARQARDHRRDRASR